MTHLSLALTHYVIKIPTNYSLYIHTARMLKFNCEVIIVMDGSVPKMHFNACLLGADYVNIVSTIIKGWNMFVIFKYLLLAADCECARCGVIINVFN